ncbi:hypothetical protein ACFY3U_14505 [Micromonospora sp. NPDC000089]|uniref:hypothetical protein n=1 Tax=Micromonospora sp. NPDC000089 TaxID=3364213 RepID=UPI0036795B49
MALRDDYNTDLTGDQISRGNDKRALVGYFTQLLEDDRSRVAAAVILYRAIKLATYRRVEAYFDAFLPEWRDRLALTHRPLGAEDSPVDPTQLPDAVVLTWLTVENDWVEEIESSGPRQVPPLIARSLSRGPLPTPGEGPSARLAALLELAFADVVRVVEARRATSLGPADRLVPDCLFELLLADDDCARALVPHAVLEPSFRRTIPLADGPLVAVRRRPQVPRQGSPVERKPSTVEPAARLAVLFDRLQGPPLRSLPSWVDDVTYTHDMAVLLQRHEPPRLIRDEDDEADEQRMMWDRAAWGLAEMLLRSIRSEGRRAEQIEGALDSLNPLGVALSSTGERRFTQMFGPALADLPQRGDFAFVSTLERSVTIVHSKHNNFRDAEQRLIRAFSHLDGLLANASPGGAGYVKLREAAQQVALQSSGMYMRLLELCLAEPSLLAELDQQTRWATLRQLGELGLQSAAYAYAELNDIDARWPLPDKKEMSRAATKRWLVNTRCMHMRALLLQATLEAVEADRAGSRTQRHYLERGSVRPLVDAVPSLFREATALPLTATYINELTRSAIHYAFLSGMTPLVATAPQSALPGHLVQARRRIGDGALSYAEFDLDGATAHLLAQRHNAGILACIAHPEVVAALERRSLPARAFRETPRSREELRRVSPYAVWRRRDQEERRLLSRAVTPEMGLHLGGTFESSRAAILRFLAGRTPL